MSVSKLRLRVLLVLASSVALGACSSGKGGGSDGAAGGDGSGDGAAGSSGGSSGGGGAAWSGGGGSGNDANAGTGGGIDSGVDQGDATDGVAGAGGAGGAVQTATMFLPDSLNNSVYRYTITPGADPTLTATIPSNLGQTVAFRSTGELFVAAYSAAAPLSRFLSSLATPVTNGAISGVGLHFPQNMRFVDDELWVLNTADHACTTETENIVRLAFDAQGTASVVGNVQTGLVGANRGMLWDSATRDLFVSQCSPVDTIQHFHVAVDHTVVALAPITGSGINNPHGMVMTAWGELFVANPTAANSGLTLLRFTFDAQGNAKANGTISGNGVDTPIGIAFAPWGELFILDDTSDPSVSRFTFDASHAAIPNGKFRLGSTNQVGLFGVAWLTIVPGASGG